MPVRLDPLRLLERTDAWYLGGGRGTLYAPAFPKWLDTPGFWDEAYFADVRLERLFCLLFLDARQRPLTLRRATRRWTPDVLTQIYTVEGRSGLRIQEERTVSPNDTLACRITVTNTGAQPVRLHALAWSLQEVHTLSAEASGATTEDVRREPDALTFIRRLAYGAGGDIPADVNGWGEVSKGAEKASADENARVFVALGGNRLPDSWTVNLAENSDTSPLWAVSLFPEKFQAERLSQEMGEKAGWNAEGLLHLALHYALEVPAGSAETFTVGAALGLDRDGTLANLRADMAGDPFASARQMWRDWFDGAPYFECDNPYLTTMYWYRWYGLRLLSVNVGAGQLPYPCVFEGIGAFRSHISYSAQCHVRELVWRRDTLELAKGCLRNFLHNGVKTPEGKGDDGWLPGHLYLWRRDRGFYHANWGAVCLQLYWLTGDEAFVREIYPGLVRYARYFDRERDRENSGLYDVIDQGETGQEYSSRYLFADAQADLWRQIQVKGVDASVYLYDLQRALALFADALGQSVEAAEWDAKAEDTRWAILKYLWDEEAGLFKDAKPDTLERSPFKAAVGFYPFCTDIADERHVAAFAAHLRNPKTFGTPFPAPASSVDDPYFDAEAEWKGKRTNCPWNGRVWPMTNSHLTDALARAARTLDQEMRPLAADFLHKYLRMMFHDSDPKRPNAYEHYNPYTGTPSLYRGVDCYQHAWVIDLIIRHVAGVLPEPGEDGAVVVDPLPFGLTSFRLEGVPVRGRLIDVLYDRIDGLRVFVNGREAARTHQLARLEVAL